MARSIEIFLCYAREDEDLRQGLEKHLRGLQLQNVISLWHDRNISAGTEWEREIDQHLSNAQIILLLISPDFMVSEYCYGIEMKRAMERHEQGDACVIPVILRHVYWRKAPFGKLQALPTDGKPIKSSGWFTQDEALYDVTEGICSVVEGLVTKNEIKHYIDTGNELFEQQQYEDAIISYGKALQRDPDSLQAHYNQGNAYIKLESYEEAIIAFDKALQIKPKDANTHEKIGDVLFHLKRYEEAIKAFQKARAISPADEYIDKKINTITNKIKALSIT